MAAGCILYARPLLVNLGVAKGVSLLGWAQQDEGFWYDGYLPYRGDGGRDLSLPRARRGCGDHGERNMSHFVWKFSFLFWVEFSYYLVIFG
jgi:hypothetical protein